jgi:ferredoxin-NADP reductase
VHADFAPALLTAIHVALAMLRRHRAGSGVLSPFVLPSMVFPITPWLWPSTTGLAIALAIHACWLVLCEIVAPPRAAPAARARLPPPRPSVDTPAAARPAAVQSSRSGAGGGAAFITSAVLAVLDEAADIKTFRIARPDGFDFRAGQFIPVRVRIDGRPHVRCYSISSSPDCRGYFEISVRRQGLVSATLHSTLRTGATVTLGRPAGAFTYPAADDRPLVLLAAGIGITPLLSMLRYVVWADPGRPVTLLYSARTERDVAFLAELKVLAERHPQVRVVLTLTRPLGPTPWRTGRINEAMIRQHVLDPAHSIFCICGPADMIAGAKQLLEHLGVPEGQIRAERFDLAAAAAVALAPRGASTEPVRVAATRRVTFAASGRTCTIAGSQTLLEAADDAGVAIPSACRAGMCQACRTRLVDGDVDCRSDVLDPDDRTAGYILPCVSWATSDCVVEA